MLAEHQRPEREGKTEPESAERPLLVSVVEEVKGTGLPRSTIYAPCYAPCASGAVRHVRQGRSVRLHRDPLDDGSARQTAAAMPGLGGRARRRRSRPAGGGRMDTTDWRRRARHYRRPATGEAASFSNRGHLQGR